MPNPFVLAFALGVTACAPVAYTLRPGDLPAMMTHVASDQRVATWNHAIAVLLDEGFVPQVLDEGACYISAKQRDDAAVNGLAGAYAIVAIAPDGTVRVEVGGGGIYDSSAKLQLDVQTIQARLTREIASPAFVVAPPSA